MGALRQIAGQVCAVQHSNHQPQDQAKAERVELRKGKVYGQPRWGMWTGMGMPNVLATRVEFFELHIHGTEFIFS